MSSRPTCLSLRSAFGAVLATVVIPLAVAIAFTSCQTTTVDTGSEYKITEGTSESVLDSRLRKLTADSTAYPKRHDLHYEIAGIHFEKQDYHGSVAALRSALELAPSEPKYHFQLGRVYLRMQELAAAERHFRQAVAFSPKGRYSGFHAALGLVLSLRGAHEEAAAEFQRCIETEPDNTEYYYSLGAQYDLMGKREEAIRCFQEYLLRGGKTYRENTRFLLQKLGVPVGDLPSPSARDDDLGLEPAVGRPGDSSPRPAQSPGASVADE